MAVFNRAEVMYALCLLINTPAEKGLCPNLRAYIERFRQADNIYNIFLQNILQQIRNYTNCHQLN